MTPPNPSQPFILKISSNIRRKNQFLWISNRWITPPHQHICFEQLIVIIIINKSRYQSRIYMISIMVKAMWSNGLRDCNKAWVDTLQHRYQWVTVPWCFPCFSCITFPVVLAQSLCAEYHSPIVMTYKWLFAHGLIMMSWRLL